LRKDPTLRRTPSPAQNSFSFYKNLFEKKEERGQCLTLFRFAAIPYSSSTAREGKVQAKENTQLSTSSKACVSLFAEGCAVGCFRLRSAYWWRREKEIKHEKAVGLNPVGARGCPP